MSKYKNQHYLSKFFLKRFSKSSEYNGRKSINCHYWDIKEQSCKKKNPKNISTKSYLFSSISIENGEYDHQLEEKYASNENEVASVLRDFLDKRKELDPKSQKILIDFFSLYLFRSMSPKIQDKLSKLLPEGESNIEKIIYDQAKAYAHNSLVDIQKGLLLLVEDIGNKIKDKNWSFYHINNDEKSFVTSDCPIYFYPDLGLNNPDLKIVFTLGSKLVWIIHGKGKERSNKDIENNALIDKINYKTIANATELIIGDNEDLVCGLVKNRNKYPTNLFVEL